MRADGINSVVPNETVGQLPAGVPDNRNRYDTEGRSVYFAESKIAAFAEVLQAFRVHVLSLAKDAAAIGMSVADYRKQVTKESHELGNPGPGEIPVEWQMNRSLYRVQMPKSDWWVRIDAGETLTALTNAFQWPQLLTLSDVAGENRSLTTRIAQLMRLAVLDNGTLPLGIDFPSKTGYGRCWAWFNRRLDDGLSAGRNDPELVEELNVNVPELHQLCTQWDLELIK